MKFVSDELLIYQYILKEGKLKKKMCIATRLPITNWLTKKFQNPIYFFNAGNLINKQEFSVILEIFFWDFHVLHITWPMGTFFLQRQTIKILWRSRVDKAAIFLPLNSKRIKYYISTKQHTSIVHKTLVWQESIFLEFCLTYFSFSAQVVALFDTFPVSILYSTFHKGFKLLEFIIPIY